MCGAPAGHAFATNLRQAFEKLLKSVNGVAQGCHHVVAKFRLVTELGDVGHEQRQLANRVLYVMNDEGEALVELFELARVGQRLGGFFLDEIGSQLQGDDANETFVLPIKLLGRPGL